MPLYQQQALPEVTILMDVPSWPDDLVSKRDHNKFAKKSIREMMEFHVRVNLKKHFEEGAAERYKYAKRNPKYIRSKLRRFPASKGLDLVKRGGSKRKILKRGTLRTPGTAIKGTLRVFYKSAFDFRGGTGKVDKRATGWGKIFQSHAQISIQQMRSEVKVITKKEAQKLAQMLKDLYMKKITLLVSTRKRKFVKKTT
tara:strand:- start:1836 stop:2429 length:594 start_codon:yes stop_codon:yes gene_type:complete